MSDVGWTVRDGGVVAGELRLKTRRAEFKLVAADWPLPALLYTDSTLQSHLTLDNVY